MKSKTIKSLAAVVLTVSLLIPTLSACSTNKKEANEKERVLRVATSFGYGDDDEYFRQQFTDIFEYTHPKIKLEIVQTTDYNKYNYQQYNANNPQPNPLEDLKTAMKGANPPDVVMVSSDQLSSLIDDNLLKPLDSKITKDKFNIKDYVPAVIDGLRDIGDGSLYALAPTFNSSALVYNKKIFTDAGVPFPTDGMTWDDVFNLARRVSKGEGDKRVFGFNFNTYQGSDLFWNIDTYAGGKQLSTFDETGDKMTVDSDQWEQVWKTLIQLSKDKVLPGAIDYNNQKQSQEYNPFQYDNFLSGKLAMAIIGNSQVNDIINANKNGDNIKGFQKIDWDVVTMPVQPETPDMGGSIYMNGIFGINSKASNPDDAWEFIKFINGEDWAKLKSKSAYNLVSRKSFIKPKEGLEYNIGAFYKLKPLPTSDDNLLMQDQKLAQALSQARQLGQSKFQQALEGKIDVRTALKQWQTEGDALLTKLKKNSGATNQSGGEATSSVDIAK